MSKRTVIYTRVSRDDSGQGRSNETQREKCEGLAKLYDWTLVGIEEDISISAYDEKKKRPAWDRVLGMAERGEVDVIVAYNMDRMTRSMRELERLILVSEQHEVGVVTFEGEINLTNEMGRMVARILTAVARAEVERKGARQKRANQKRASEGNPWKTGFRAMGYTLSGDLVEEEANLIRKAAEEVLDGKPLRAVVREWTELGVKTSRQRKNMKGWTHNSVRAVLLNPRNAGISTYKGEVIGKGQWEPIFSEETHVLLVATLNDPSRSRGDKSTGNKPRNLLSGIAECGECGWKVEAGSSNGSKVYKCSNPSGDHITTARDEADQIVRNAFALSIATTIPGTVIESRPNTVPSELWSERKKINDRLDLATQRWAEGTMDDDRFNMVDESLRGQLAEVDAKIEAVAAQPEDTDLNSEEVRNFLQQDLWAQRKVLEDLTTIRLWSKNKRKNVPMKQQITIHITDRRGKTWAALDERNGSAPDPSAATYEALADILVAAQPEGVTTLSSAAEWLVDNRHTDRSPGGLPGKLSPVVRYVRGETRGAAGWTRKNSR